TCVYRPSQPSHLRRRPSLKQFSSRRPLSQQSSTASSTSSSSMPILSPCLSQSCHQLHPSTYERKRPSSCVDGRTAWMRPDHCVPPVRSSPSRPRPCPLPHCCRRRRHRPDDQWSSRRGSMPRALDPGPVSCVQPPLTPRFAISSAASR